jgi:hypothetical protein
MLVFGGHIFKQIVGMLIGTDCAPLFAGLFPYAYKADFT